jgi:outer membrane receptor for ferrienterochelin and colicins
MSRPIAASHAGSCSAPLLAALLVAATCWANVALAQEEPVDPEADGEEWPGYESTVYGDGEDDSGWAEGPEDTERIDVSAWRRRGATSLADALAALTGGTPTEASATVGALLVDGLPAAQLQVLHDGFPVSRLINTQTGPAVDLAGIAVPSGDVAQVEVSRGDGATAGRGGAVSVNLVSATPPEHGQAWGSASLSAAPDGLLQQHYELGLSQPLFGDVAGQLSGTWRDTEPVDVNADARFDSPDRRLGSGRLGLVWAPSDNEHLRFDLALSDQTTEVLGDPTAPLFDRTETRDVTGRATGRWWLNRDLELRHGVQYQRFDHLFEKEARPSALRRTISDTTLDEGRANGSLTWYLAEHDVRADVSGVFGNVARDGSSGGVPTRTQGGATLGLSDTWYASAVTTLESAASVRADSADGLGGAASLGASFAVTEALTLRSGTSYAQRQPTAEERYLFFDHSEVGYQVQGNDVLRPERVASGYVGLRLAPRAGAGDVALEVEARAFYHHLFDAIETTLVRPQDGATAALYTYTNAGEAHTAGTNLRVEVGDLPGDLTLVASWAFLPLAQDLERDEPLTLRTEHRASGELRGEWIDGRLEAWVLVGTRGALVVDDALPAAPAFLDLGAGVSTRLYEGLRLTVLGQNLLDQTNATWGPVPGRAVMSTLAFDVSWGRENAL